MHHIILLCFKSIFNIAIAITTSPAMNKINANKILEMEKTKLELVRKLELLTSALNFDTGHSERNSLQ